MHYIGLYVKFIVEYLFYFIHPSKGFLCRKNSPLCWKPPLLWRAAM